jgi:hypothetical protein
MIRLLATVQQIIRSSNLVLLLARLTLLLSAGVVSGVIIVNQSNASNVQQFKATDQRIEAVLGAGVVNRVRVQFGELMEVVGNEQQYLLDWSTDYRNLFITPKLPVGENIEVSLLMAGGIVQDMRFTVGDCSAQTVLLKGASDKQEAAYDKIIDHSVLFNPQLTKEVAAMMRAMIENTQGKYYVSHGKRALASRQDTQITQIQSYRYQDLSGAVLEVVNLSRQPVELEESYFKDLFKGVIAINISAKSLPKGGRALVRLISKDGDNE